MIAKYFDSINLCFFIKVNYQQNLKKIVMKKISKMLRCSGLLIAICLFLVSCAKNESTDNIDDLSKNEVLSVAELHSSDEVELISEEITILAEDVYTVDEISFSSKSIFTSDYLPDCVTITTVITDTNKEKTIDFGDGCELRNGNFLSGIIILTYSKDMEAATKTLSLSLENFTFNRVAVEGNANIVRTRTNENGNPQSVAGANFDAEWPDGETVEYSANRTREWIEGYGSGVWGDNVFLISGMATYKGKLGNVFTKNSVEPLRREMACRFIVSGVVEISRNDTKISLDFGNGSCDPTGILTYPDGTSEEVYLRRFYKKFPPKFPF